MDSGSGYVNNSVVYEVSPDMLEEVRYFLRANPINKPFIFSLSRLSCKLDELVLLVWGFLQVFFWNEFISFALLSSHIASDPELCYQMTRPWESRPEFLPCLVVYSIAFVVRTGIFHWTVKSNEGIIVYYPNPLSLWIYHLSECQDWFFIWHLFTFLHLSCRHSYHITSLLSLVHYITSV